MSSPQPVHAWDEPEGIAPRGTLVLLPGRGEHGGVYERFGRRIAADGYRVRALADPSPAPDAVIDQAAKLLRDETLPGPRVLVGSDTGAVYAAWLAARGAPGLDGLILAGLPTTPHAVAATSGWEAELDQRTACPTHRGRLASDDAFRRGALTDTDPAGLPALEGVSVPVLALHGADDPVSPLPEAVRAYRALPGVELVSLAGTRHDALNDLTHRTAAATIVLYLERLRLSSDLAPIAVREDLA
ncbi:alpha-beta hydrolase superfamily lysophospholipase [Streptomyces africanus]|uniref:Alpha-beta hydrolase superfamily lysophospholipase n=1 Tax=Streptomyces africanus TaxID=231024 RepID=A0ABU0R3F8_9ACTN|nr:lysophospholipase [Streptomyces africanus]MDQ0753284.1 alpha-beta hydrolase superfamily lysophospholipase [Streptomyces africanus]